MVPAETAVEHNISFDSFARDIMANYAEIQGSRSQEADNSDVDSEICEYMGESIPPIDVDILMWWSERSHKYPLLSVLARFILAIPASSAAPERNFSIAGYIVSDRRSRLSASTVEDILICKNNIDLYDANAMQTAE